MQTQLLSACIHCTLHRLLCKFLFSHLGKILYIWSFLEFWNFSNQFPSHFPLDLEHQDHLILRALSQTSRKLVGNVSTFLEASYIGHPIPSLHRFLWIHTTKNAQIMQQKMLRQIHDIRILRCQAGGLVYIGMANNLVYWVCSLVHFPVRSNMCCMTDLELWSLELISFIIVYQ